MKNLVFIFVMLFCCQNIHAQKATSEKEPPVPCTDQANADVLPGKYTDHTNTKYPTSLKGNAQDKAAMTKQLISLEKLEEASRKNFTLTGCVARVSFSGGNKSYNNNVQLANYGYQLGVYQNVCHVTQHIVKTVGEYRTVFRVDINPVLVGASYYGDRGDFYITDKSVRYDIDIDAKRGANYDKERFSNPGRITRFISEDMVLTGRSDDYKNKHADFLKIINGDGYVENWLGGSRDDKRPNTYKWVDRHYLITRPGVPLLVPVTRKEYLEALLEYYEIEKANFLWMVAYKIKDNSKNAGICEADKVAYQEIYENKKAKVQQLLTTQKTEWLQKPAVVSKSRDSRPNDYYKASNGLFDFDKFYDGDSESNMLYQYNPEYFKTNSNQSTKPILMEVQFRYEIGDNRGFSERLFNNFLKNYDMAALRKMVE